MEQEPLNLIENVWKDVCLEYRTTVLWESSTATVFF